MLWTLALVLSSSASETLVTYRAQHRPAAELVTLAETALGLDGTVTLDARTATLILNGTPEAVHRALALLARLDRPLRNIALTSAIVEDAELDRLGIRVDWTAASGGLAVGTLPPGGNELKVALGAGHGQARSRSSSTLRLVEGTSGFLVTGEAFPFVYRPYLGTEAVDFLPAETGFEAEATLLGDGRVALHLRPFSGRLAPSGGLRYTGASTEVVVSSGATVVLAELSRDTRGTKRSLAGVESGEANERQVLLVTVELETP